MAVFSGNGSAASPSFTFSSDTNLGIYRGGTDILSFTTAGSDRVTIDASGDVGIGTDSPEAKLHLIDSSSTGIRSQSQNVQGTDSNKALHVSNGNTTDTFNVSYRGQGYFAGNVGIGTDNPQTELEVNGNIQSTSQNGGQLAGLRNAIINGGMEVWQRGETITVLGTSDSSLGVNITNSNFFGCDRWSSRSTNGSGGQCQHILANANFGKKLKLVTTNNTSYQYIQQLIEVQNCIYLSNQECTFSWYSDRSTSRVRVSSYDATGARVTDLDYTVTPTSLGNSRYSVTFDMSQINPNAGEEAEKGVQIILYPDSQNTLNGSTEFWGVQLELGPVATPFEKRSIAAEEALCQRYFYKFTGSSGGMWFAIGGWSSDALRVQANCLTPQSMRVTPSVSFTGTIDIMASNTAYSITNIGCFGTAPNWIINVSSSTFPGTTGTAYAMRANGTDRTISYDAEL